MLPVILMSAKAQDIALKQLEDSPRRHEWVMVKSGEKSVYVFNAYPEVSEKVLVAIKAYGKLL